MSLEADCHEEAALLRLADETLQPDERVRVQHHVDLCKSCRDRLEALRATLDLAATASSPQQNPLFAAGFSYKVRQGIERRRHRKRRLRSSAGIAVVCGCIMVAVWFAKLTNSSPEMVVPLSGEVVIGVGDEVGSIADEELASLIDTYLLETASTDELMGQMEGFDSKELVAMFEEE
jgi:anti-sigma factor RsiW